MDVLIAPGLAPPATLPPDLVAAQGIALFRAASAAWASDVTDDPASTAWSARLLGDVELSQSSVDALGIGGRVALGLADIEMWDGDGAFSDLVRYGTADGRKVTIRVAPAPIPARPTLAPPWRAPRSPFRASSAPSITPTSSGPGWRWSTSPSGWLFPSNPRATPAPAA